MDRSRLGAKRGCQSMKTLLSEQYEIEAGKGPRNRFYSPTGVLAAATKTTASSPRSMMLQRGRKPRSSCSRALARCKLPRASFRFRQRCAPKLSLVAPGPAHLLFYGAALRLKGRSSSRDRNWVAADRRRFSRRQSGGEGRQVIQTISGVVAVGATLAAMITREPVYS